MALAVSWLMSLGINAVWTEEINYYTPSTAICVGVHDIVSRASPLRFRGNVIQCRNRSWGGRPPAVTSPFPWLDATPGSVYLIAFIWRSFEKNAIGCNLRDPICLCKVMRNTMCKNGIYKESNNRLISRITHLLYCLSRSDSLFERSARSYSQRSKHIIRSSK